MNYTLVIIIAVVVCLLIVVAVSTVTRFRGMAIEEPILPEDELSEFRRMREEGSITEEEFRRLKSVVASQTVDKVKEQVDP